MRTWTSILLFLNFCVLIQTGTLAQSQLVLNDGGMIVMNGGTETTPIYLVVENPSVSAISRLNNGHIVSEGEYNIVSWFIQENTGVYTYHLGKNNGEYLPLVFNITSAGTESGTGRMDVSSWYTVDNLECPDNTIICLDESSCIDRFWVTEPKGYTSEPIADVTFYYLDSEMDGINEDELIAQKWNASLSESCKWETPGASTVFSSENYVKESHVSNYYPWTLSSESNPLPVELTNFSCVCTEPFPTIEWETNSEINNDFFLIQYSYDGSTFINSTIVEGAGYSNENLFYSVPLTQLEISDRQIYFRLVQIDYDGTESYSEIITSHCFEDDGNSSDTFDYYLSENSIVLVYPTRKEEHCVLSLYDTAGRLMVSTSERLSIENPNLTLQTGRLAKGIYILSLSTSTESIAKKILVSH